MERTAELMKLLRLSLAVLFCFIAAGEEAFAERFRFQWEGRLGVSEQYDDNIFLTPDEKEDDWITQLTPGLTLSLLTDEIQASLLYDFSLVKYAKNDERSVVRHRLTLSGFEGVPVAKHVTLDLDAYLLISEDPLEIAPVDEDIVDLARSRDRYYRTTAGGRINYLFGPENSVYAGFTGLFLIDEGEETGDRKQYIPSGGLEYWFGIRYGLQAEYSYGKTDFELGDDYIQQRATGSFRYRSNPRTEADLTYLYDNLNYDGPRIGSGGSCRGARRRSRHPSFVPGMWSPR